MALAGESSGNNSHRKKPVCDQCGDEGKKDLLVPCAKCHIAYEHCYCLQELSFTTSVHFVCAECSEILVQERLNSDSNKAVTIRKKARVESSNPVPRWKKIPETSKMKLISPEEVRKLASGGSKSSFKVPKSVPARFTTTGLTRQTAFVPRTLSLNSAGLASASKPPSPPALQMRSRVIGRESQAPGVVEGSKSKVGDGSMSYDSEEISESIVYKLLPYQPALHPIWKGSILDSTTPAEFSGEFVAQPACTISVKHYKLAKAIPTLLKVQLVPIHSLLTDLFKNRIPELSDIEIYMFHDDNSSERCKEDHVHLFEAMRTHNAMIRISINDTPLLIFSSTLLDKSSQVFIKKQKKISNFLWGIFILSEKSLALVPGASIQTF